ncbi:Zinc finger BED domain-containing protein 5 [Trichinella pseudospiralis]|uniref:Zinc finger BED domain-containing protein 5 n=1 Tax=Trichinella pseudospiralis TaxID=6337 RepID=A0A0V0YCS0_TRIPS|nr:Zinc finger BED domain-containing protein 5 [Trichinella pseudospiralis]
MGRGPLVGRGFRDKEIFNTLDGLIKDKRLNMNFDISVKIVNHIKSRPLQCHLLEVLCADMGSMHYSFLLRSELTQFWLNVLQAYPNSSAAALKVLHPFKSSYLCEIGFPVMVAMKTQFRNRLQLFESLRLKVTAIEVDIYAVIKAT